jgi:hypothetical protein
MGPRDRDFGRCKCRFQPLKLLERQSHHHQNPAMDPRPTNPKRDPPVHAAFLLINEPPVLLVDTVLLTEGTHLVGRERTAAICLPDNTVSREHATIDVTASTVTIHDLKSLNGTFVDDQPVVHGTPVNVGQHLRFGRVSFELVREDEGGNVLERERSQRNAGNKKTPQPCCTRFDPSPPPNARF